MANSYNTIVRPFGELLSKFLSRLGDEESVPNANSLHLSPSNCEIFKKKPRYFRQFFYTKIYRKISRYFRVPKIHTKNHLIFSEKKPRKIMRNSEINLRPLE